jgi:hypothetical protein
MLFRDIAVYSEYHMKPISTLCGQKAELLSVKVDGTYSSHCALKGCSAVVMRVFAVGDSSQEEKEQNYATK